MLQSGYFVYILQCADHTYYIGITNNLWKRLRMHNGLIQGGAKYTRGKRPVILRYYEQYANHRSAAKREYQLKKLTREEKSRLCDACTCALT